MPFCSGVNKSIWLCLTGPKKVHRIPFKSKRVSVDPLVGPQPVISLALYLDAPACNLVETQEKVKFGQKLLRLVGPPLFRCVLASL